MKKVKTSCLIILHAGRQYGLGHLSRSLLVEKILVKRFNCNTKLLIIGDQFKNKLLDKLNHRFLISVTDYNQILNICIRYQMVVFDLYKPAINKTLGELLLKINKKTKIISIDSMIEYKDIIDLVFLPSFQVRNQSIKDHPKVVYGWDCLLLKVSSCFYEWEEGNKVMILTGGSDVKGLAKTFPSILTKDFHDHVFFNWVRGPFSEAPTVPNNYRSRFTIYDNPEKIEDIMCASNYAITIFGISFFELIYLGIPTVVFSIFPEKDSFHLNVIEKLNIALVAKDHKEASKKLSKLILDKDLALTLSRNSKSIFPQSGETRLGDEIQKILISNQDLN